MAQNMSNEQTRALQAVQDDIDLYKTLLISLDEFNEEDEDTRTYYQEKLAELNEQLAKMGNTLSTPREDPPQSSTPSTSAYHSSPSRQLLSLPNRKRARGEFEDGVDSQNGPKIKSRRSTPAAGSPALSRVDSVSSDYFDEPELHNLLGENWRGSVQDAVEYQRQQAAKKRQEEEDEKLARKLQEEWGVPQSASSLSQPPQPQPQTAKTFPSASQTQATFGPNGSFSRPAFTIPQFKDEQSPSVGTPISVSSDDEDGLALIDPAEFNARFPTTAPQSRALPSGFGRSMNLPGSFPSSSYASLPGTSVYGTSQQPQHGLLGSIPGLQGLTSLPGLGGLFGTASQPVDLDNLPSSVYDRLSNSVLPDSWATVDPKETQEEIRQLLHNIRPDEEIDISEAGENQPEGLKVRLMPHQLKGVAWMRKTEEGSMKGGILADDMGLGKTVQAIALMLARPPPPGKTKKPTLIVTPVALMEQWKREIAKMVRSNAALSVVILHGQKASTSWADIRHRDVVLTSYGTLASEFKKKLKWEERLKSNPDAVPTKKDNFPVLDDKAKFHRVFLDEAQWIKNRNTQAAAAACRVDAEFRWALTGTPMQNSIDEIYSLIRFLRIRPYNDVEKFNKDIGRPLKARHEFSQQKAMEKLQALLKAILLRRTKKSEIDGKPILQLPDKRVIEDRAIFSDDQFKFYKALETQSQIQFNRYVKQGSVGRNYSKALVLLLRLRQCCCSPQLITNSADFVEDSGVEGTDLVANAKELPSDVVNRLKADTEVLECPCCYDAMENAIIFQCGHAFCHGCFSKLIDTVGMNNEAVRCPNCRAPIDTKKITDYVSFKEVFLDGGVIANNDLDVEEDSDYDSETDSDSFDESEPEDGQDLRDFIVNDDDDDALEAENSSDDDDDLNRTKEPRKIVKSTSKPKKTNLETAENEDEDNDLNPKQPSSKKSKGKQRSNKAKKGKKKAKKEHKSLADLRKEGIKSKAAHKRYLRQLAKIYQPCAKIDKVFEILNEVHNRGENEKTIIFSSFTSFLDLIEVPLNEQEHLTNYARYDGSMTAKRRNEEVLRFTDDPNCKIILVSLKAGNAGLNLTVANHCLILDPFWNPFTEEQASDRCYRIGQRREVTVHRVLIGEEGIDHAANPEYQYTVEDRILALQEKKRRLIESALDENASSSVGRLGVRELGYLFGVNDLPARSGT